MQLPDIRVGMFMQNTNECEQHLQYRMLQYQNIR